MKKFVCLLMAVMLVMSFAAYAVVQYEPCPCGGRAKYGTISERFGTHTCDTKGSHPAYVRYTGYYCNQCEEFSWDAPEETEVYCTCSCVDCQYWKA